MIDPIFHLCYIIDAGNSPYRESEVVSLTVEELTSAKSKYVFDYMLI